MGLPPNLAFPNGMAFPFPHHGLGQDQGLAPAPGAAGPAPAAPPGTAHQPNMGMPFMPPAYFGMMMPPPPPPPMPVPNLSAMSEEELRGLEGDGRRALEMRVTHLRNIQALLDAAVIQFSQYLSLITPPVVPAAATAAPTPSPTTGSGSYERLISHSLAHVLLFFSLHKMSGCGSLFHRDVFAASGSRIDGGKGSARRAGQRGSGCRGRRCGRGTGRVGCSQETETGSICSSVIAGSMDGGREFYCFSIGQVASYAPSFMLLQIDCSVRTVKGSFFKPTCAGPSWRRKQSND